MELKDRIHSIDNKLVDLKELYVDHKRENYDSSINILKETHYIKKSQANNNKITYSLMFLSGTAFGLSHKSWSPYVEILWDFFSNFILRG